MSEASIKEKQVVIDEIRGKFDKASSAVVIDYKGITVSEADDMRRKLREAGVDYKVYKNTMVNRAVEGTDYAELSQVLAGPSAFAFGFEDATAPARILLGVMKEYKKMTFKAGIVDGTFYDEAGMSAIAAVPAREELLARLFGSFKSPIGAFARVVNAIAEAGGEAPAEEAKPEEAEAKAEEKAEAPAEEEAKPEEAEAKKEEATPEEKAETKAEEKDEAPAEEAAPEEKAEEKAEEAESKAEEAKPEEAEAKKEEAKPEEAEEKAPE